jgi:putative glutathione S-transferase
MLNGKWNNDERITADARGAFIRAESQFRNWITADGSAGPTGNAGFKAEPGRYHLFVSYSCPWAHRTIIFRKLKKLENIVSMSLADRPKTEGWSYSEAIDDFKPGDDGIFRLHQAYAAADANYTGKVTVPTLWDRERRTIVNNESSEIIRMFNNTAFPRTPTWPTTSIRRGYAARSIASTRLFTAISITVFIGPDSRAARRPTRKPPQGVRLPGHDGGVITRATPFAGERITEADWRAFPTLLRFDVVYYSHFKCNLRRPGLSESGQLSA